MSTTISTPPEAVDSSPALGLVDASTTEPHDGDWSPTRWIGLSIAIAAAFMDLLDTTIVNVAIPSIRGDLAATYASIEWVLSGYLLAFAVGLVTGGRLGDLFGRRRIFLVGVVGFGITSLLSGIAPNAEVLIGARVLQGLSGALMVPQVLAMVQVSFPRDEQVKALSIYSSVAGVAVMTGPMLAGVLLAVNPFDLGWRSIFLVNVPVCVAIVFGALRWMPETRSPHARTLDLGGVAIISVALFLLVFALIEGRQEGWPAWSVGMLAAVAPLLAVFALYERRLERRGASPLVPLSLFAIRTFAAGSLVGLVFFSGLVGFFLVFTIFLQLGLGFTAMESALTTFPSSVGLVISALVSAKFVPKLGRHLLHLGLVSMAVAQLGLLLVVHQFRGDLSAWEVRPVILFFGIGMGMILPQLADYVLSGVDRRDAGAASGVLNTGMQVGNVLGVVVTGLILFSVLGSHAQTSAEAQRAPLAAELAAAGVSTQQVSVIGTAFEQCFVDRSQDEDPSAVPPSCGALAVAQAAVANGSQSAVAAGTQGAGGLDASSRVARVMDRASTAAREDNFVASVQPALAYEILVLLLTFGLLFLLPLHPRAAADPVAAT